MPSLVGLRDVAPFSSMEKQAKEDTLKAIQMEALGLKRRDFLSTTDFKENKASYVSTVELEAQRLVNNSSISKGEKSKLEGWNNAWTHLQVAGTDSQQLQDVNEGMGQTHRVKLMDDNSVRAYTSEMNIRERGPGGRLGRGNYSARAGSSAGRVTGRIDRARAKEGRRLTPQTESHQPVTRVRVPKGHHPTIQPNGPHRQPAPQPTTVSAIGSAKEEINISGVSITSVRRPVLGYNSTLAAPSAFMASVSRPKKHPLEESGIEDHLSVTNITKEEAAGHDTGTSISKIATTTSSSNEKAMRHVFSTSPVNSASANTTTSAGKSAISAGFCPKDDLMDLDISQETIQPVLQFTALSTKEQPYEPVMEEYSSFDQKIEALEKSGVLNATQLEALKMIQAQVHARTNPLGQAKDAPCQGSHSISRLEALAAKPKVTAGIAGDLAEQQDAFLIGEHVHKTRYHSAMSLTEDFEKLSISDKEPAEPAVTDFPSTKEPRMTSDKKSTKPTATDTFASEKPKINPFSPAPAKGKGPGLPVQLSHLITAADHGAGAHARSSDGKYILAQVLDRQPLRDFIALPQANRRNKINETGFIALAENHAAGKRGESPLLIAPNQGL